MKKYDEIQAAAKAFSEAIESISGRVGIVCWSTVNEDGHIICGKYSSSSEDLSIVNQMILEMINSMSNEDETEKTSNPQEG